MKKMMYIRLKIAVCAILLSATMFSCTKEEMVAEPLRKGPEIGFGVNLGWEADKIGTKSGYGKKQGEFVLRSSELEDTLAVGVYVQNGINLNEEPKTKGAVTSSENLDKFGVWCQLTNGNNESISYFSNLEVSRDLSSGVCSSDTYYWPGSDFTKLEFLAVGPYAPEGLTPDNTILPTSFTYTVPEEAVDQTDIIIATPKYSTESAAYPGNYDTQINLNFNHILSAINVKVGSIPAGTINSIIISGVAKGGKYSVGGNTWSNFVAQEDGESFAVDFGENDKYTTTGNETGNPQINAANATFMMVPQNLSESAELIVNFTHEATGRTYDLKASLKDQQWLMGNTHNYLINITPDYIIEIVEEEVPIADCHYDVREITISDDQNVGWTLTSNVDWVKFRVKPADYETNEYKDYWVEMHTVQTIEIELDQATEESKETKNEVINYPIENTIKGSGDATILVYYSENIEDSSSGANTRDAIISVSSAHSKQEEESMTIRQYYPLWNNNIAYERIEEDQGIYPWGFATSRSITYTYPSLMPSWADDNILFYLIYLIFQDWIEADGREARSNDYTEFYNTYVNTTSNKTTNFVTISGTASSQWSATLDYGKLNNINANGTGLQNTIDILGYVGGGTSGNDAETWLINNSFTTSNENSQTDNTTIPETAVYQAVKKNAWTSSTIITTTKVIPKDGSTPKIETKTVNSIELSNGIKWFLPSNGEIADLKSTAWDGDPDNNNDEPLTGTYWTSTSGSGTTAYYYAADATTGTAVSRVSTTKHKVRAARSKN